MASIHLFRQRCVSAVYAIFLLGCSSTTAPPTYSGTYTLQTVDGQPLPFRLPGTAFGGRTGFVTGGEIELGVLAYRYSIKRHWIEPNGATWLDSDDVEQGTYSVTYGHFNFQYTTGVRNGLYFSIPPASNTEITYTDTEHTYHFVRGQ